ncbi:class I SAM-dependent methyltransferase [Desulfuromonas sp. AOP6]|uniref:class I SAM-dependent methyltransferase n=1 Tax=Desulfuromonas sp. AOP6 TaxID=1566351 RepID=UPI0012DDAF34|nr:class I SAM-dependent methyltransferase [Desulfuromonas sp. AOP6]
MSAASPEWIYDLKSFDKVRLQSDQAFSCPVCATPVFDISYVFENEGKKSNFFQCPECSFLFARPIFIPELDHRQMDGLENAELFNSRMLKRIYVHYFIKKEIRALRRVKGKGALRLLDIGCGTGWTTKVYADQGFEVTGLEPSKGRAEFAREKYGIDVICDYIENVEITEKFDVVVLRHIVEHFSAPGLVLRKIRGFLKDDGVVLVIVPNINCLGRYLFETKWAWVLPWHCNFFSPKSLQAFLNHEYFKVLEFYQTPTPLYYPGAIMRVFPHKIVKWVFGKNRVVAMMLCAPLAVAGKLMGMGDNLNLVAKVK